MLAHFLLLVWGWSSPVAFTTGEIFAVEQLQYHTGSAAFHEIIWACLVIMMVSVAGGIALALMKAADDVKREWGVNADSPEATAEP
jgi:hypothetical protein